MEDMRFEESSGRHEVAGKERLIEDEGEKGRQRLRI